MDVQRRRDILLQQTAGSSSSSSSAGAVVGAGQFLCPLLEPLLYLVTACERCMGGDLTELGKTLIYHNRKILSYYELYVPTSHCSFPHCTGLLMGTPLELPRGDIMEIAEDFNDTDREVSEEEKSRRM